MKIIDLYDQVAKGIQPEKFKYKNRWFAYSVDDKEFRSLQEIINGYPKYIYLSELIDLSNLNDNVGTMNESLIELVNNNLDLPVFAWVNGEICKDDCGYWLGQFGKAEIREYAKVESYGWYERDYVFKDDYEDYLDYLLDTNKNLTEEEAKNQILNLDYKKAIFVYIDLPDKF